MERDCSNATTKNEWRMFVVIYILYERIFSLLAIWHCGWGSSILREAHTHTHTHLASPHKTLLPHTWCAKGSWRTVIAHTPYIRRIRYILTADRNAVAMCININNNVPRAEMSETRTVVAYARDAYLDACCARCWSPRGRLLCAGRHQARSRDRPVSRRHKRVSTLAPKTGPKVLMTAT